METNNWTCKQRDIQLQRALFISKEPRQQGGPGYGRMWPFHCEQWAFIWCTEGLAGCCQQGLATGFDSVWAIHQLEPRRHHSRWPKIQRLSNRWAQVLGLRWAAGAYRELHLHQQSRQKHRCDSGTINLWNQPHLSNALASNGPAILQADSMEQDTWQAAPGVEPICFHAERHFCRLRQYRYHKRFMH